MSKTTHTTTRKTKRVKTTKEWGLPIQKVVNKINKSKLIFIDFYTKISFIENISNEVLLFTSNEIKNSTESSILIPPEMILTLHLKGEKKEIEDFSFNISFVGKADSKKKKIKNPKKYYKIIEEKIVKNQNGLFV